MTRTASTNEIIDQKLRRFGTLESGCNTQVYVQYSPLKKI